MRSNAFTKTRICATKPRIFGRRVLELAQLLLDAPDVPDLAEADQLVDVVARRQSRLGRCGVEVLAAGMACVS